MPQDFHSEDVFEELRGLEMMLLTETVRKNRATVSALLSEEFREFGSSGQVLTRSAILDLLRDEAPIQITMEDFRVQKIADSVALVTYRSISLPEPSVRKALRSSLWRYENDGWKLVFHQGTLTT